MKDILFIKPGPRKGSHYYAFYRCYCGMEFMCRKDAVSTGRTTTCPGCAFKGQVRHIKHGMSRKGQWAPEYTVWSGMLNRCGHYGTHMQRRKNPRSWPYYAGRKIVVCERWRNSFEAFFKDMGPRPSPEHSIDRFPDNTGNYEPGNCRWATRKQQVANRKLVQKNAFKCTHTDRKHYGLGLCRTCYSRHVYSRRKQS